jgi:hypothetical protein
VDPHRLAEERSLAAHRVIAERMRTDPGILEAARRRVADWIAGGQVAAVYAQAWDRLLHGPLDDLVALLCDPGEHARALRQMTPFAGAISPRERWRIWAEVRASLEGKP